MATRAQSGALLKLVKLRWDESKGNKPPPENELPDNIFDVKFVNEAGVYEPGALAPAEKARLPGGDFREALATVQELVLWFPLDIRLYWLLGELYAARGDVSGSISDFEAARRIMDECVGSGHYSNRKTLMQHREAVTRAASAAAPRPEPAQPQPAAVPFSFGAIWIYFGAVGVIALFALFRALTRKKASGATGGLVR